MSSSEAAHDATTLHFLPIQKTGSDALITALKLTSETCEKAAKMTMS